MCIGESGPGCFLTKTSMCSAASGRLDSLILITAQPVLKLDGHCFNDDVAAGSVIHAVVQRTCVPAVLFQQFTYAVLSPGSGLCCCFGPDIVLGLCLTGYVTQ